MVFVYLYFMVTKSVIKATSKETTLAAITGASVIMMPYTSHNMAPTDTMSGMNREMSLASFSFQTRIICGNSENVVNKAAT